MGVPCGRREHPLSAAPAADAEGWQDIIRIYKTSELDELSGGIKPLSPVGAFGDEE
ncbi:hypothetical protein ACX80L_15920 [Arthrobacter sp. MDT1-48-3]